MKTIQIYRSYSFKDKDPEIDRMRTLVADSGLTYKEIHNRSDVSVTTLYNWFEGKTRKPQNPTMEAVGRALGFKREWVPLNRTELAQIKPKPATKKRKRKANK